MLHTRWQWWLAAGVVLVLALLIVSPLAAQSPAPSAQQNAGAVCPLSDDQTQKATEAFDQLAHTFTTQPRCVNCHGGVNPFAPDGGNHAGGKMDPVFKQVPVDDKELIASGIKTAVVDDKKTNEDQCQECHSGLLHWRLAPPNDVFKGRTALQICKHQKSEFGNPDRFAAHIDHDVTDVAFIDTAFAGTRGLNDMGQAMATGPFPDKPKGVTKDQLYALAQQWANALRGEFQGDEECGCAPGHHYALFLDEKSDSETDVGTGGHVSYHTYGQAQLPLTFKDDGSFTGSGDEQRIINASSKAPGVSCTYTTGKQTVSWMVSGSVDGSDVNTPGVLHIQLRERAPDYTTTITCRSANGFTQSNAVSTGGFEERDHLPDMPDIPAVVAETSTTTVTGGPRVGAYVTNLTIRQLD